MFGAIKIDGQLYRFMGDAIGDEGNVQQRSVIVAPVTTTYEFDIGGISLQLNFTTPAVDLDRDITAASRPVTHVSIAVQSNDSNYDHDVQVYFDNSAEGAVADPAEHVAWSRLNSSQLFLMQVGTTEQKVVGQGSDRINWGHWLLSTPKTPGVHTVMAEAATCRNAFLQGSYFDLKDDHTAPRAAQDRSPVLSVAWDLGRLTLNARAERHAAIGYDQIVSIRYFGTDMKPLWRTRWDNPVALMEALEASRLSDLAAASAFNEDLVSNLTEVGGGEYSTIGSLAYRQVIGGTQAVWNPLLKEPWVFMKEISSDGDVSTVDVIYPALPLFKYLYPSYFRLMLVPLLVYGNNGTKPYGVNVPYNLSWAPHHLGQWPVCDLAPQDQEQMPLEESANVLIIIAALHQELRDLAYLQNFWPMLDDWADFIVESLPDPGNQLCTDDFEGASPHNANLALKGILALDAYSTVLNDKGDTDKALRYHNLAQAFAMNWTTMASDGDHFRMQFDLPGSWSQKYNLLWQLVLGLETFPEHVLQTETAYYLKKLNKCGVPLDDRKIYTKSDWSLWSATMEPVTGFMKIMKTVYTFAHTTPDRAPLSDWYDTKSCKMIGFRARPVQGGLFARMIVKVAAEKPYEKPSAVFV